MNLDDNHNIDVKKSKKKRKPVSPSMLEGFGEEKKKPLGADGNLAASLIEPILPNMPTLWVRSENGGIKVLNNTPAAAPSAAEPGVRIKAKKNMKGAPTNDTDLWAAFEKQQNEEKQQKEKKTVKVSKRKSSKVSNKMVVSVPATGVKISLEENSESIKMKEDEITRTLLEQSLKFEKQNSKKESAIAKQAKLKEDPKKKVAPRSPFRKVTTDHHAHYITHDTYMFHLHQPHLMSPLFKLPSERRMLFGQYDEKLEFFEKKVQQKYIFRPMESAFLPAKVDLSIPIKLN